MIINVPVSISYADLLLSGGNILLFTSVVYKLNAINLNLFAATPLEGGAGATNIFGGTFGQSPIVSGTYSYNGLDQAFGLVGGNTNNSAGVLNSDITFLDAVNRQIMSYNNINIECKGNLILSYFPTKIDPVFFSLSGSLQVS